MTPTGIFRSYPLLLVSPAPVTLPGAEDPVLVPQMDVVDLNHNGTADYTPQGQFVEPSLEPDLGALVRQAREENRRYLMADDLRDAGCVYVSLDGEPARRGSLKQLAEQVTGSPEAACAIDTQAGELLIYRA